MRKSKQRRDIIKQLCSLQIYLLMDELLKSRIKIADSAHIGMLPRTYMCDQALLHVSLGMRPLLILINITSDY